MFAKRHTPATTRLCAFRDDGMLNNINLIKSNIRRLDRFNQTVEYM